MNASDRNCSASFAFVVIGRNEGERLRRCLYSLLRAEKPMVYVDSCSSDGSAELARSINVDVVELDPQPTPTAARARNAGFKHLLERHPGTSIVQFVDGDCEIHEGWPPAAIDELSSDGNIAIVFGRLRERDRASSIYRRLCDMDWPRASGEVESCGGVFAIAAERFQGLGGFNEKIVAGEEAELCSRIRGEGGKIVGLEVMMANHDSGMSRFGQWWRRTMRTGQAYEEGATLYGEAHNTRQVWSSLFWGLFVPLLVCASVVASIWNLWFLSSTVFLFALYLRLLSKIYYHRIREGDSSPDSRLYASFCALGKIPQAMGIVVYKASRWIGRRSPRYDK